MLTDEFLHFVGHQITSPEKKRQVLAKLQLFMEQGHGDKRSAHALCLFFQEEVENSNYSLLQWAEAIEQILNWLGKRKLQASLSHIIEYIVCCIDEKSSGHGAIRIWDAVGPMLEQHGLDRAYSSKS